MTQRHANQPHCPALTAALIAITLLTMGAATAQAQDRNLDQRDQPEDGPERFGAAEPRRIPAAGIRLERLPHR